MEYWKTIKNYNNYDVSNLGRVRKKHKDGYIYIKPRLHNQGYLRVSMSNEKTKKKDFYIHRLVGQEFIVNDDIKTKTQINHKNEIKSDNRVENLEWCTHKYNSSYGTKRERLSNYKKRKIKKIDILTGVYEIYDSSRVASKYGFKKRYSGHDISVSQNRDYKYRKYLWIYV